MIHKIQIAVLLALIPLGALYLYAEHQGIPMREIFSPGVTVAHVGEIPITVEVVDTPEKRTLGLSGRKELDTSGMLFVFDSSDYHGIWMKDMLFAIDIIWIDESLSVVGIEERVRPDSYPRTFRPPVPARYAIETVENYVDTFGIGVGDAVRLPILVEEKR